MIIWCKGTFRILTCYVCRRLLSSSTFLQLITWILLIITKLAIYVISFINFPGLFFVPVLIQFFVTLLVLTFTKVSPSFHASAWHDRYITIQSVLGWTFSWQGWSTAWFAVFFPWQCQMILSGSCKMSAWTSELNWYYILNLANWYASLPALMCQLPLTWWHLFNDLHFLLT